MWVALANQHPSKLYWWEVMSAAKAVDMKKDLVI
jgi:hypothetical protein